MQKKEDQLTKESKSQLIFIEIIIYLLFALGPLTGNVILILFGPLSSEFSVDPSAILIAIPSFMFPFAFTQLFSGAISDIKGRVQVILFGLIIFGIGMILALVSFSLSTYIIANILGGIGFGFVNPVLIALLTDITPSPDIPKKMGYLGAFANLGVGVGPILAGLIASFNWRYLYVIFLLIIIFGFVVLVRLRKWSIKSNQAGGIRLFLTHISKEMRRKVVILMILSTFFVTQTYLAIITWTSRSFTNVPEIPIILAGFVVGSAGISGAIAGVIIGYIIKKQGIKVAMFIGLINLYLSIIILLILKDITEFGLLPFTTIGLILTGIAGGILLPSMMYYSQILSKQRRGALAGLLTAGQFTGIALVPIIYNWFFHIGGIRVVYLVVLIISFILLVNIITLYKSAKREEIRKI